MSNFLSRLVERAFGLTTVVQPVIDSIFSPELSVKNDYMQGLIHDSKAVSNQNGIYTASSRKTKTEQHDGQPALNSNRSINEDYATSTDQIEELDNSNGFSSLPKKLHKREQITKPFKQNDSNSYDNLGSHEQTRLLPLSKMSEDNQYLYKAPAELTQNGKSLYKAGSDSLGSVESELLYTEDRGNQRVSKLLTKSMIPEEQFYGVRWSFQESSEPVIHSTDNPTGKKLLSHASEPISISGNSSSLESDELNGKLTLQDHELASKSNFNPPSHRHLDPRSSPITPSRQSLKQASIEQANAFRNETGNELVEQRLIARRSPSIEPTIKVTIGRIEVRAVKPPITSQPQAPSLRQRPILSLDDYLKQYNG